MHHFIDLYVFLGYLILRWLDTKLYYRMGLPEYLKMLFCY